MEWVEDAYVLTSRPHGEAGAIVDLLTEGRGRFVAHVAGGASRRMKPVLQPGSRVIVNYRSRVSEQLGSASLELVGEGVSAPSFSSVSVAIRKFAWRGRRVRSEFPNLQPH